MKRPPISNSRLHLLVVMVLAVLIETDCGSHVADVEAKGEFPRSMNAQNGQAGVHVHPSAVSQVHKAPEHYETVFDMTARIDQGHFRSNGLIIDFGTSFRHKYTLGDWKSGWRGDLSSDGITYSEIVGEKASVLFDLLPQEAGGGLLVLRGRAGTVQTAQIFLNRAWVGRARFNRDRFTDSEIFVKSGLEPGMNELVIVPDSSRGAAVEDKAKILVDSMIVAGGLDDEAAAAYDASRIENLAQEPGFISLGYSEALSFNLPVPDQAHLELEARSPLYGASGLMEVAALLDSGEEHTLAELEFGNISESVPVPLMPINGRSATLILRVLGGDVVISDARLVVPAVPRKRVPGKLRAKNFILVLVDTLRSDRLDLYNSRTPVKTRFFNHLGNESVVFERALAPENWTKPSVTTLLSGLYPHSHRVQKGDSVLPETVEIAPQYFKRKGFASVALVANGYISKKFGFDRGWDTYWGYGSDKKSNKAYLIVNDALKWLKKHPRHKRFFMYIHLVDPHAPYKPPKAFWTPYDRHRYFGPIQPSRTADLLKQINSREIELTVRDKVRLEALYNGEVTYNDFHLQRLRNQLKKQGILEDTLIVVTSDHGEEFFDHGMVGHGQSLYEELIHVPLVVRLPGAKPGRGFRSNLEVSLADVLPTACEVLGIPPPPGIQGRSVTTALEGDELLDFPRASFADSLSFSQRAVRLGRFKAIFTRMRSELYDLENDPKETRDVGAEYPVSLLVLRDALGEHLGASVVSDLHGEPVGAARHEAQSVTIDPQTASQLRALGYFH